MELDTIQVLHLTVMSKKMFDSLWAEVHAPKLNHTSTSLRTYTGKPLKVLGALAVAGCKGARPMSTGTGLA